MNGNEMCVFVCVGAEGKWPSRISQHRVVFTKTNTNRMPTTMNLYESNAFTVFCSYLLSLSLWSSLFNTESVWKCSDVYRTDEQIHMDVSVRYNRFDPVNAARWMCVCAYFLCKSIFRRPKNLGSRNCAACIVGASLVLVAIVCVYDWCCCRVYGRMCECVCVRLYANAENMIVTEATWYTPPGNETPTG